MVLIMESDGSLTPSRSQNSFSRNYNDGIGQGSASDGLAIFGEREAEPEDIQLAALARPAPLGYCALAETKLTTGFFYKPEELPTRHTRRQTVVCERLGHGCTSS